MADETDLERAVTEMLSDIDKRDGNVVQTQTEAEYWKGCYGVMADRYFALCDKLEEILRKEQQ
jgi:hypothetical protein